MEPFIDLIWSVEEEIKPDHDMIMGANCGGNGGCGGCSSTPTIPPFLTAWVCH